MARLQRRIGVSKKFFALGGAAPTELRSNPRLTGRAVAMRDSEKDRRDQDESADPTVDWSERALRGGSGRGGRGTDVCAVHCVSKMRFRVKQTLRWVDIMGLF